MFNQPIAITLDIAGDLFYISDYNNNRITKHTLSTGAFIGANGNTVGTTGTCPAAGATGGFCTGGTFGFGSSDGMFNLPSSIALDATRNLLFVGDVSTWRVQKFDLGAGGVAIGAIGTTSASTGTCPASGNVSGWCTGGTFTVGTGDGAFSTIRSLTTDTTNGFLYVVDSGLFRIAKINSVTGAFVGAYGKLSASTGTCPSSGTPTFWCTGGTFASGTGDGMFSSPWSIAFSPNYSYFYVSDGHRIQWLR
jgi:hypothetical protein